jgi:aspartate/methionine/tyrosine aminotransferase
MQLYNVDPSGYDELYKLVSINLCPNTIGQCAVDLVCSHPTSKECAPLFQSEYSALFESLKERANIVSVEMNKIEGIECTNIDGAMYAFPTIKIPAGAVQEAQKKNIAADAFYCLRLLEDAGICCVPGSGFGQKDGTFHLRTTILPPQNEIQQVVQRFREFHMSFAKKFQ